MASGPTAGLLARRRVECMAANPLTTRHMFLSSPPVSVPAYLNSCSLPVKRSSSSLFTISLERNFFDSHTSLIPEDDVFLLTFLHPRHRVCKFSPDSAEKMSSCVMAASAVSRGLPALGSSKTLGQQTRALGLPQIALRRSTPSSAGLRVRAAKKDVPLPDTKVEISEEAVKRNEKEEPLRVFDNTPAGKFARPESERRPEMGNTNFFSVMRFDGPAPETINGRLAMLGFTWAVAAEVMTGQSVAQQVVDGTGGFWFLAVAPILIFASFVPIFRWNESPDSRKFGPFNAKAERWNGRAAMIGFASLLLTENLLIHGPLFGFLHQ